MTLLRALAAAALAAAPRLVHFKAADGTPLAAGFVAPAKGEPAFVLLHGVGAGRGEWAPLVAALTKEGYGSLAVDFRGHGDSGGPPYTTFRTDAAWLALEGDIRAAVGFLAARGVSERRVGLVGGSIGANLAAKVAASDPRLPCLALLSPGVEYRGIGIDEELSRFTRPVFLAASPSDPYAFESAAYLRGRVPGKRATFVRGEQGHGAQMLAHGLIPPLLAWMKSACVRPRS